MSQVEKAEPLEDNQQQQDNEQQHDDDANEEPQSKPPPRKRRRLVISCTECHRRKQKVRSHLAFPNSPRLGQQCAALLTPAEPGLSV
jgi:ribosomal protein L44E